MNEIMNVCLFVCPFGCLSGVVGPFNGLRLTRNHFQTLPGHAGHHVDQFLSPPLSSSPYEGPDRHFVGRARVSVRGFLSPHSGRRAVRSNLELILVFFDDDDNSKNKNIK